MRHYLRAENQLGYIHNVLLPTALVHRIDSDMAVVRAEARMQVAAIVLAEIGWCEKLADVVTHVVGNIEQQQRVLHDNALTQIRLNVLRNGSGNIVDGTTWRIGDYKRYRFLGITRGID